MGNSYSDKLVRNLKVKLRVEASAATRERLLEAGLQLLQEQPVGSGVDHLRATEVARRAGVTHGAFYQHWPSQHDYRDELIDYVLGEFRTGREYAQTQEVVVATRPQGFVEAIRAGGEVNFVNLLQDPGWLVMVGLHARNDPELSDKLRRQYHQAAEAPASLYQEFLEAFGVSFRPPISIQHFAVLRRALAEGLALRARVDPEAVEPVFDEEGHPWSLFSLGMLGLVAGLTRREGDLTSLLEDARDRLEGTSPRSEQGQGP
jgi:AcrR family transcriptional regulator